MKFLIFFSIRTYSGLSPALCGVLDPLREVGYRPKGGTQIWFRRGCAAEAAKPVPIHVFKGHFGGKGYPLLGVFIQENDVLVTYFSDEIGENI